MTLNNFPIQNPTPDIDLMIDVLTGKKRAKHVFYAELIIDDEILEEFTFKYLKREWHPYVRSDLSMRKKYWDNVVECYYRLGYSSLRVSNGIMFDFPMTESNDASASSDKNRKWTEHVGMIETADDYDRYPFPNPDDFDMFDYEYVSSILPEGMGITACVYGGILEMLCEYLIGFENMSYMLYDNEELLEKVFKKVGDILYAGYEKIVALPKVKALFQGDDMGYDLGLMFSPDIMRKYVLPWHKKMAGLAHRYNKYYFLHSCGNLRDIAKDLIEIGIDAKHSFEDKGYAVVDYKSDYGNQIGIIGGVDVDKLCRMEKLEFEKYCLNILNHCTKGQRYVFGSGNSIANYVPLEKFLQMLDICRKYVPE